MTLDELPKEEITSANKVFFNKYRFALSSNYYCCSFFIINSLVILFSCTPNPTVMKALILSVKYTHLFRFKKTPMPRKKLGSIAIMFPEHANDLLVVLHAQAGFITWTIVNIQNDPTPKSDKQSMISIKGNILSLFHIILCIL